MPKAGKHANDGKGRKTRQVLCNDKFWRQLISRFFFFLVGGGEHFATLTFHDFPELAFKFMLHGTIRNDDFCATEPRFLMYVTWDDF